LSLKTIYEIFSQYSQAKGKIMAYIDLISPEEASGVLKQEYDKAIRRHGRIANILRVLSRSPSALKNMMHTYLACMFGPSELSRGQREMLATVVSSTNECFY